MSVYKEAMECEHKFDDERVCFYCALETHPLLTPKRPKDSYEYKRPKKRSGNNPRSRRFKFRL